MARTVIKNLLVDFGDMSAKRLSCIRCGRRIPNPRRGRATCSKQCGMALATYRRQEKRAVMFVPLMIGGQIAVVWLTKGMHTIIDASDWSTLSRFKWFARSSPTAGNYYAATTIHRKTVGMHTMLVAPAEGLEPDHRNRNPLDNRRSNLRPATHAQNIANTVWPIKSRHGFRGVRQQRSGRFQAAIGYQGKWLPLGTYSTTLEAARAYDAAACRLHGEFAILNFAAVGNGSER